MAETRVWVESGTDRTASEFAIRINGPDATFRLASDRIAAKLVGPVDDLLLDLLDVAGSIFAADSTIGRGGKTRSELGRAWRRRFEMTIPVRCSEVWSRPEVNDALVDAATFLTDDDFDISFTARQSEARVQEYFDFSGSGPTGFTADEVILFSGGLDSLAGALETLSTTTKRVALVTHQSAPKIIAHQKILAKALSDRFSGRVLSIPVKATRVGTEAKETTQRSRSLLFAAIGHVVARMLGAQNLNFFENGIVSHNLPISPQVIGTMATRTTHPASLQKIGHLLALIDPETVCIQNKFAWLTKTEVVAKIAEHGGADLICDAVSCTSVRDQTTLHTHCGACSQCMDRRFAILAAGLEEHEPADMYLTDVLLGERLDDASRTLALDWTAHGSKFSERSIGDFFNQYAGELGRIVAGYPEVPPRETVRHSHDLHQRHGDCVRRVLASTLKAHADDLVKGIVPAQSLLRMFIAQSSTAVSLPDLRSPKPDGNLIIDPPRIDKTPTSIFPLQVAFAEERDWLEVLGLGAVKGPPASVAHALLVVYDEDMSARRSIDQHRFVMAGKLEFPQPTTKGAVRQMVRRCRELLAEYYQVIEGTEPPRPLLIETSSKNGYRLDPTMKKVATPSRT